MKARAFVAFALSVTYVKSDSTIDIEVYCKLSCKSGGKAIPNSVCEYQLKTGPACVEFRALPLSLQERQYILDQHNHLRQTVASGNDTRGGNGAAANMMALNYDVELEVPAMAWAMQCQWSHDKCRTTPKFPHAVGQNLYESSNSKDGHQLDRSQLKLCMDVWYSEIADTSADVIKKFSSNVKGRKVMIGHYTQLVWAETTHVGCVRVAYKRPKSKTPYIVYILCNYGPAGNYLSLPVYVFGAPASKCPGKTKPNSQYPALCGEIKELKAEKLLPAKLTAARSILSKYLLILLTFVGCLAQYFKTWL